VPGGFVCFFFFPRNKQYLTSVSLPIPHSPFPIHHSPLTILIQPSAFFLPLLAAVSARAETKLRRDGWEVHFADRFLTDFPLTESPPSVIIPTRPCPMPREKIGTIAGTGTTT
jgi:hypothetical protein